jgi:hypothetical protein
MDDDGARRSSEVLGNALRSLDPASDGVGRVEILVSSAAIILRERDATGAVTVVRHPLDLVERGVAAGVAALEDAGLLDRPRCCLIAVPRGSLSGTFTGIYEVVRRCGWSVLPLGGSEDAGDIAALCEAFDVDVLFVPSGSLDAVFITTMADRFLGVRQALVVGGHPSDATVAKIATIFPSIELRPFLLASELTGPVGRPLLGRDLTAYEILDHVLMEVRRPDGDVALRGSGELLVSILGVDDSALVRRSIGERGVLATALNGVQVVKISPPEPSA